MSKRIHPALGSTINDTPGYRIVRPLSMVSGTTVHSRSIVGISARH